MDNSALDDPNLARHSKDVRVLEVTLTTKAGEVTLRHIYEEIQIFEDIYTNCLSGNISISDSRGIPELFEMEGGEKLNIIYRSALRETNLSLDFYVYRLSERFVTKDKNSVYTIYFSTKEYFRNNLVKISKAFHGYSDKLVPEILSNNIYGLNSQKKLETEQSVVPIDFIPPLWDPLKTINWLANKSTPGGDAFGSPFYFFETKKQFYFCSLQYLLTKPVAKTYKYSPRLLEGGVRDVADDSTKVEQYYVKSSLDILTRIRQGVIAAKLKVFDIYDKTYQERVFSTDVMNPSKPTDKSFDGIFLREAYDAKQAVLFKQSSAFAQSKTDVTDAVGITRDAKQADLHDITLELTVSGDSDINVGDVVVFNVPSQETTDDGSRKIDESLSGKYLLTAIAHYIKPDSYEMKLEISKDSQNQSLGSKSIYVQSAQL